MTEETLSNNTQSDVPHNTLRSGAVAGAGKFTDVALGAASCGLILVTLVLFVLFYEHGQPNPRLLILLAGTAGAALGWGTGIILSPYDSNEKQTFEGIAKTVYGVIVGYAVAKVDPLITTLILEAQKGAIDPLVGISIGVGGTAFVAVATVTYISRKYWE